MIIKKVLFFHNVLLPLLVVIVSWAAFLSYGFTIKGFIGLIVMIYCMIVIGFANTYNECLLKKMKDREEYYEKIIKKLLRRISNEKTQSSNIHKGIN